MSFKEHPPFFQSNIEVMKKKSILTPMLLLLFLVTIGSCREKGLQNIRGEVRHVEIKGDTLLSMTIGINARGDTAVFNLDDARFQNGIMMYRDSVIVDYVHGHGDTLRALVVTVLPKIRKFDEPIFIDTLITLPKKHELLEE
jgi:hypothetical protein